LVWPISGGAAADIISSPFGPRWQASRGHYEYHAGIDIPALQDTPAHVVADGVVYKVGWLSVDSGLAVIVYHAALGYYTAYLHLNSALVAKDQALTQGQVIGLVGDSGTTDLMHLHFEIRLTSSDYPACTRNPMGYLRRPEASVPAIQITELQARPPYSMTVSVVITASRQELDVNQVCMTVQDRMTGAIVDDQMIDLNRRFAHGLRSARPGWHPADPFPL